MTVSESAAVVAQLRQARRRQRVAQIHWVDAFYQVYLTAIVAIVAVVFLSGLTGDGHSKVGGVFDADPRAEETAHCAASKLSFAFAATFSAVKPNFFMSRFPSALSP